MKKLPFRHLSVRVPWHDHGWDGSICRKPRDNSACLCLGAIRENREDGWEHDNRGKMIAELGGKLPPCVTERAAFMCAKKQANIELTHKLIHDDLYKHMRPTPLELPAHSAPAVPFRWVMREQAEALNGVWNFGYDPVREPQDGWKENSNWVLHPDNQRACLEAFWSAVEPGRSLCFFYAKQVPFAETNERILVGVGRVSALGRLREYVKGDPNGFGAWVWERSVIHSIRAPDFTDGFLLPYQALMEKAATDPSLNPADFLAFAPNDTPGRRDEFSYVTEHVSNGAAIAGLQSCREAILRMKDVLPGDWSTVLDWINERLTEVWRIRGAFPGLGSALTAFGVPEGAFVAAELARDLPDEASVWDKVDAAFANPSILPGPLRNQLSPMLRGKYELVKMKKPERFALLKLLSRFEISAEQMRSLYDEQCREEQGIGQDDADFLRDPYLIFHETRRLADPVSVWTVDQGMHPTGPAGVHHPVPEPSKPNGPDDPRRVTALAVQALAEAEGAGHSVLPRSHVVARIREFTAEPLCPVDKDLLEVIEEMHEPLEESIAVHHPEGGESLYQLEERDDLCSLLRGLKRRIERGARSSSGVDWGASYDVFTAQLTKDVARLTTDELAEARAERVAALKEMAESPLTVLIGPAGTGKTTLLEILCEEPAIKAGGVLLLAPTGKARVRLAEKTKLPAQTLAQFLLPSGRYDATMQRYQRSAVPPQAGAKTIVVDESSMLTEDQLAALLDAMTGYDRIILVGDPSQLPPIGVGRPFVDLVEMARKLDGPHKGHGYAELTVRFRQKKAAAESGAMPPDLLLAEWFSGRPSGPADDEIFNQLSKSPDLGRLRIVQWKDVAELRELLPKVLAEELSEHMAGPDDVAGFGVSLGGTRKDQGKVYFNWDSAQEAEAWQILCPVRSLPGGSNELNRLIQKAYRLSALEYARSRQTRAWRIPKPVGPEEIVYGDKIINARNRKAGRGCSVYPKEGALGYVANGEIGLVVGPVHHADDKQWFPSQVQAVFATQPKHSYYFSPSLFGDDVESQLELAYAITVHKAQGSEFDLVFLVVPERCPTLSRELLYTALTRQKKRIVLLVQGEVWSLKKFGATEHSESTRRFTYLFDAPEPVQIVALTTAVGSETPAKIPWQDGRFIHRTRSGTAVESKSEVIVANELDHAGIRFIYGQTVEAFGERRVPDFTITHPDTNETYYWEHCGLLHKKDYSDRWQRKLVWYGRQGITEWDREQNPKGRLIATRDDANGGIDSAVVAAIIRDLFQQ